MSGRIERADGAVIPLNLVFQGEYGGEISPEPGEVQYLLKPEETLYINYGQLVFQVRYIRQTKLFPTPFWSKVNYTWLNTLVLAFFIHFTAIGYFLKGVPPDEYLQTDILSPAVNQYITVRLKQRVEDRKAGRTGGLVGELQKPSKSAKARGRRRNRRPS